MSQYDAKVSLWTLKGEDQFDKIELGATLTTTKTRSIVSLLGGRTSVLEVPSGTKLTVLEVGNEWLNRHTILGINYPK